MGQSLLKLQVTRGKTRKGVHNNLSIYMKYTKEIRFTPIQVWCVEPYTRQEGRYFPVMYGVYVASPRIHFGALEPGLQKTEYVGTSRFHVTPKTQLPSLTLRPKFSHQFTNHSPHQFSQIHLLFSIPPGFCVSSHQPLGD